MIFGWSLFLSKFVIINNEGKRYHSQSQIIHHWIQNRSILSFIEDEDERIMLQDKIKEMLQEAGDVYDVEVKRNSYGFFTFAFASFKNK